MDDDVAIKVEGVSKDFILPHEKASSVKGIFTSMFRDATRKKSVQHALRDINFEVKKGEFFGIVGRNGSGKSTLLKILAGIYQPTKGTTHVRGKLVPFIELGVGFNAELSGRDNVYLNGAMLGFSVSEVDAMYKEIVEFAELERFMDQKLKNYSSGMQVRLAFSMAIRSEADVLLLDEVLAVGDADFQKKCYRHFKNLKKQKKTVVFVSHDMNAVQEYCDTALLIEKSEIVTRGSSYDVAMAYTRMFLDQDKAKDLQRSKARWGSGDLKYTKLELSSNKITSNEDITLTTYAEVSRDVSEAILGFKVRADDDTSLVGSNTKLKNHALKNLKKGDHIKITWTFPNILNTGRYLIDLAIQGEGYVDTYDWWEGAAVLQIEQQENNSYPTHPAIEAKVVKNEK